MPGQIFASIGNFLSGEIAMTLYWSAAVGGTLFFLIILCFSTFEMPSDSVDLDGDGVLDHVDTGFTDFQLISLKSILAFVTMFGWTGVVWGYTGLLGFIAALLVGGFAMFLTALVVWLIYKLQHSGNVAKEDFVGKTGTVYLTIPANRSGSGKVTVAVSGSTHEISAVADEEIATGAPVRIEQLISDTLYLVRKV